MKIISCITGKPPSHDFLEDEGFPKFEINDAEINTNEDFAPPLPPTHQETEDTSYDKERCERMQVKTWDDATTLVAISTSSVRFM